MTNKDKFICMMFASLFISILLWITLGLAFKYIRYWTIDDYEILKKYPNEYIKVSPKVLDAINNYYVTENNKGYDKESHTNMD